MWLCANGNPREFFEKIYPSGKFRPYFASNRQADQLTFNDIFRHAARHSLISGDACDRWLEYRAVRNDTAHDCREHFGE